MKPKQKGFTLIELLVVISIIGFLASVILVATGSARTKARDAKKLADKKQVITALNLYYNILVVGLRVPVEDFNQAV